MCVRGEMRGQVAQLLRGPRPTCAQSCPTSCGKIYKALPSLLFVCLFVCLFCCCLFVFVVVYLFLLLFVCFCCCLFVFSRVGRAWERDVYMYQVLPCCTRAHSPSPHQPPTFGYSIVFQLMLTKNYSKNQRFKVRGGGWIL